MTTPRTFRSAAVRGLRLLLSAAIAAFGYSCSPTVAQLAAERKLDRFPSVTLSNGLLCARVYLPDAGAGIYRGPRFDWSGMVGPVTYRGHWFFSPFRVPHDPAGNDDGIGPAEEFGMDAGLGYADTKALGTFIKIGVGELIKPDDPAYREYHFYKRFQIARSPAWQFARGPGWVEFHQTLRDPRGWGYDYVKRVELVADQPLLIVQHRLTNIGWKVIDTTWYCHNMVNIDGEAIGPAYAVDFPFAPIFTPALEATDVQTRGDRLTFVRALPSGYGISTDASAGGGSSLAAAAVVWNRDARAGVGITGSEPLVKYHLYAVRTAVCPEMFIRIHLDSGQTQVWESRYGFIVGSDSMRH